jgi:transposase
MLINDRIVEEILRRLDALSDEVQEINRAVRERSTSGDAQLTALDRRRCEFLRRYLLNGKQSVLFTSADIIEAATLDRGTMWPELIELFPGDESRLANRIGCGIRHLAKYELGQARLIRHSDDHGVAVWQLLRVSRV